MTATECKKLRDARKLICKKYVAKIALHSSPRTPQHVTIPIATPLIDVGTISDTYRNKVTIKQSAIIDDKKIKPVIIQWAETK